MLNEVACGCYVCGTSARMLQAGDRVRITCPRCGTILMTGTLAAMLANAPLTTKEAAVVSGWLAENRPTLITEYDLPKLRALRPPSVQSRLDRLLLAIVRDTTALGEDFDLQQDGRIPRYTATTYSQNEGELQYLIESLHKLNLVDAGAHWYFPAVTPHGYAYVEDRLGKNLESPIGFCAMWFNNEVLPLWTEAISPAINDAGFDPRRIDTVEHDDRIDEAILALIRRSRFLVADLTAQRHGVYFEAGFAAGLGLPVIWMVRADHLRDVHFDNRQYNFIVWNPSDYADAKARLQARIEATIGRGPRAVI